MLKLIVAKEKSLISLDDNNKNSCDTIATIISNNNLASCKLLKCENTRKACVIEAFIGAVYLDSNKNMDIVEEIVVKIIENCNHKIYPNFEDLK